MPNFWFGVTSYCIAVIAETLYDSYISNLLMGDCKGRGGSIRSPLLFFSEGDKLGKVPDKVWIYCLFVVVISLGLILFAHWDINDEPRIVKKLEFRDRTNVIVQERLLVKRLPGSVQTEVVKEVWDRQAALDAANGMFARGGPDE